MAIAVWPLSLPQHPQAGQWVWVPQRNKVSFQPELGPSIDRRRGSSAVREYSAAFTLKSSAQVEAFEDWFNGDLADGVLPFEYVDPVTGVTHQWKFSADEQPYQITANRGTIFVLSMKLVRLT